MKVVKYGHILPRYAFCTGCGAILEFTQADMQMSTLHISKGVQNNGKDYVVHCPICGRAIYDGQFKDSAEEC